MDNNLQNQIDQLKARLDALNQSQTIPLAVDRSFNARGFVKTDFFVAGRGAFGAFGVYVLSIPNSTANSVLLVSPAAENTAPVFGSMQRSYADNNYGASNSRFDITNPAGTTFRYTWDGTGTDPNISATTLPVGSRIQIFSPNFNPANQNAASRPFFYVTGSGNNYFEIDNTTPGVAENDVTIGSGGVIVGGPQAQGYEMIVYGTAMDKFSFVVFMFDKLYADNI